MKITRKIEIAKKALVIGFCFSLIPILLGFLGHNFIIALYAGIAIFISLSVILYIMAVLSENSFYEIFSKEDLRLLEKYSN